MKLNINVKTIYDEKAKNAVVNYSVSRLRILSIVIGVIIFIVGILLIFIYNDVLEKILNAVIFAFASIFVPYLFTFLSRRSIRKSLAAADNKTIEYLFTDYDVVINTLNPDGSSSTKSITYDEIVIVAEYMDYFLIIIKNCSDTYPVTVSGLSEHDANELRAFFDENLKERYYRKRKK